jgi:hypothetical protein
VVSATNPHGRNLGFLDPEPLLGKLNENPNLFLKANIVHIGSIQRPHFST